LSSVDYLVSAGPTVDRPPLCVDLDGTLVRCDTLLESALALLKRPVELVRGLLALSKGKASMKRSMAAAADIDVRLLPYNDELLDFLRLGARSGRKLILRREPISTSLTRLRATCKSSTRFWPRTARTI
jgi:hypothetical protein